MSSDPGLITEFIAARAQEYPSPLASAGAMIASLHKEAHGECWVCRYEDYPCTTLRLVAQSWSGHGEYDPSWRP